MFAGVRAGAAVGAGPGLSAGGGAESRAGRPTERAESGGGAVGEDAAHSVCQVSTQMQLQITQHT